MIFSNAHIPSSSPGYGFCLLSIDFTSYWWPHVCLLTFPIISHNLAKKVVKDAIGCHLLLDTHLHRSVQGCCCIQGLLWRTRGNLLGCDYSLCYGIFPLPYCKVLLAKTSETIIIQTISVLFCVYDIGG